MRRIKTEHRLLLHWAGIVACLVISVLRLPVDVFSARQHICYSALYVIARPSVCPSVCHTGGSVKDGWS